MLLFTCFNDELGTNVACCEGKRTAVNTDAVLCSHQAVVQRVYVVCISPSGTAIRQKTTWRQASGFSLSCWPCPALGEVGEAHRAQGVSALPHVLRPLCRQEPLFCFPWLYFTSSFLFPTLSLWICRLKASWDPTRKWCRILAVGPAPDLPS